MLLTPWQSALLNETCSGISPCLGVGLPGDCRLYSTFFSGGQFRLRGSKTEDRRFWKQEVSGGYLVGLKLLMQGLLVLMVTSLRKRSGLSDSVRLSDDW